MYSVPLHSHLRNFWREAQNLRSYKLSRSPKYFCYFLKQSFYLILGQEQSSLSNHMLSQWMMLQHAFPPKLCIKDPFSTTILSQYSTLQEEKLILNT